MSLTRHLELGSPLIWVNSQEPDRVLDAVILNTKREVYRMDPFEGLHLYRDDTWLTVLVDYPDGSQGPCFKFEVAIQEVYKNKGLLIINNAHLAAKELLDPLGSLYSRYRQAFFANNADELPFQTVLISCTGEIPPELARHVAIVNDLELPMPEELAEIAVNIKDQIGIEKVLHDSDIDRVAYYAAGLSESEFIQSTLLSIKQHGNINPDFINDFKLNKIKSGGILEIRQPKISLDDIGGLDNAKEIIRAVGWMWENSEEVAKLSIKPIHTMLMIGVPGTGKSAICEATAKTLGLDLAKFGVSSMMSKWIGESESNMRMAFRQIKAMAPLVCWGDELGRDLSGSGSANDSGTTDRVHGEFLTGLQELPDNVLFMAAANRIDGLPPEMLRAGRFDKIMFVGFPTVEERVEIFRIHLGDLANEFNLENLASVTPLFTGAEIQGLIEEVKFKVSVMQRRAMTNEDIISYAPEMRNRVWIRHKNAIVDMYRIAVEEWDWASNGQLNDAEYILNGKLPGFVSTDTPPKKNRVGAKF